MFGDLTAALLLVHCATTLHLIPFGNSSLSTLELLQSFSESVGALLAQLLFRCFSLAVLLLLRQFLSVHVSFSHFLTTMQYYNQEKDDQLSDCWLCNPSPASLAVTAAVTDCLGHETLRDGRPPHLQEDSHAVLTHPPKYSSLLTLSLLLSYPKIPHTCCP